MVRRTNTGFQDGSYGPAGGHLEDGETIKQAAIRECKEEKGWQFTCAMNHFYDKLILRIGIFYVL